MEPRTTSALLYLNGVTVSFDGFRALDNLSLAIETGEMRAIIGPSGAGKTTMMDVVTGKTRPDQGEVVFDGRADLTKLDEADIATLGIGRKFQKPTVFENHTVRDTIAGGLAHGQKQWLEIGMLLAQDPKLLLVDEPVAGMTDAETRQTVELLKEINRDRTLVVVEHDMAFVRELDVKVTVLHEGSVIAEGSIDQVSANERVIEVYLGR